MATVNEVCRHLNDYIRNVEKLGRISRNYPVKPNKHELAWFKSYVGRWSKYAKWRFRRPDDAKQDYYYTSSEVVGSIQDFEYAKHKKGARPR